MEILDTRDLKRIELCNDYLNYVKKVKKKIKTGRTIRIKEGKKTYDAQVKEQLKYYLVVQNKNKTIRCIGYNSLYCSHILII